MTGPAGAATPAHSHPPSASASFPALLASARANVRQAYELALMGALGALFGLYFYVEIVRAASVYTRDALAGLFLGGCLGFFLSAHGPWRDGSWRKLARAVTRGTPAAALGGALGLVAGEWLIGTLQGGLIGRALSWSVLGLGIGLGQALAHWSRARMVFGLIGGGVGGLLGGLLFEALGQSVRARPDAGQALGATQALAITLLGGGLGLGLALVEQALRRAWVRVLNGPQEGRVYLLDRPHCRLGLDERAEIGLFGDPSVARDHAEIEATRDGHFLKPRPGAGPNGPRVHVNGTPVTGPRRLQDGDRIELGRTLLVFRQR